MVALEQMMKAADVSANMQQFGDNATVVKPPF
jgi:hypothetical protein